MENVQPKKRKFNVMDLIFILIIVVAIVAVAWKFVGKTREKVNTTSYVVTLHSDEVPSYALDAVKVGDTVQDETGDITIGTITDIKTGPAVVYGVDDKGMTVGSPKDGSVSVDFTLSVNATGTGNYITIGGTKYTVNHGFTSRCGMAKIYIRISSITPAE